jgi:hypothetical protein
VLLPESSLVKAALFGHIFGMLDVSRPREQLPERTLSPHEFRAIAEGFDFPLPWTPTNRLALMLAVGTGRFPRIVFAQEFR